VKIPLLPLLLGRISSFCASLPYTNHGPSLSIYTFVKLNVICMEYGILSAKWYNEIYLPVLQDMLKMFSIGLNTFPTPSKQILAHTL
jgi:hypothetical protein